MRNAPDSITMIAEAPVTFETKAVVPQEHEIADLVPSETSALPIIEPVGGSSSFPKVLRGRLDRFFADQNISPKADRTMWVKIAAGLAVLVGSWIALYALSPIHGSLLPSIS
jgi:linoleoyl-CoA desaturase